MEKEKNILLCNMDNMDLMSQYPNKAFGLAIVDLPYNIGASKPNKKPNVVKQNNGTSLIAECTNFTPKEWDYKKASTEYLEELFRVSKRQIIFGGNYYGLEGGYLVWDKLNGESDQFGCELAWLSFTKRTDVVYYKWSGMIQGAKCSQNIREAIFQQGDKSKNEKRIHPTQKPVILYKWLLKKYANEVDIILDTHLGSGSIAIACHDLGFDLVASEIDIEYFNDAQKRFNSHINQLQLFV